MKPASAMVTGTTPVTAGSHVIRAHPVPVFAGELKDPEVFSFAEAASSLGKWMRYWYCQLSYLLAKGYTPPGKFIEVIKFH